MLLAAGLNAFHPQLVVDELKRLLAVALKTVVVRMVDTGRLRPRCIPEVFVGGLHSGHVLAQKHLHIAYLQFLFVVVLYSN